MRIAVLAKPTGWHTQDLMRAASICEYELVTGTWRDLRGAVGTFDTSRPVAQTRDLVLDQCDVVLLRTVPSGSLEQIIFRMDLMRRLEANGVCVLNGPRAIEVAVDKYLALARMQAAGLPVPETFVCQRTDDALEAFEALGGHVVVKPLFGSEGIGLTAVDDPAVALRVFSTIERLGAVIYLQRFIPHNGSDLRLFVLDDSVLASMRRTSSDWRTNVARGAKVHRTEPESAIRDLAIRAAAACDAKMGGVDIVLDRDERPYVLEVNAVPGWRAMSSVTGIDVGAEVIRYAQRCASKGGER